ncbi:hypothetical protein MMC29_003087 [Sticta canariensis]|nr:hypothetical protein [Sticta canariensis]
MGLQDHDLPIPSNVTRISHAIKNKSSTGIPQVVSYQAGVGSTGTFLNRVVGGATAQGLSENIRGGYSFIANNYEAGDEIFLFGFSRGAFTARSIAGLIGGVGLLTKDGLPYLAEVFKDFENRWNPNYRPANPDIPFPNKPSVKDPTYREELGRRMLSSVSVNIKAIGVWDTVGSLGIPRIGWLERIGLQAKSVKEFLFFDTSLSNCIENAFQALALDESRTSFSPSVWEKTRGNRTNLRQVWFPGVHSNIGGGYEDQGQANITLAWMISQLEPFLEFDPDYVLDQYEENRDYYKKKGQKPRRWSFGEIYKSLTGVYILDGSTTRTPGNYYRVDPYTGRPTSKPLRSTNEYVHSSARSRIVLDGPGIEDHGRYEGKALQDYKLKTEDSGVENTRPFAIWAPRSRRKGSTRLPESPLWETEKDLLRTDPKMYDFILEGSRPAKHKDP